MELKRRMKKAHTVLPKQLSLHLFLILEHLISLLVKKVDPADKSLKPTILIKLQAINQAIKYFKTQLQKEDPDKPMFTQNYSQMNH